jgi:type I restriction enzyme R subunit
MGKHDTEADARILIDGLLRQAGWDPADKSQVRTEVSVSGASVLRDAPVGAEVSEEEDPRRTDYVLLAANGRPLAVTEAKRGRIDPYTAKEQTLPMAKRIGAPFIFLSNGELTYFWDYENDDARIVSSFYSRRDLERLLYLRNEAKALATVPIPDDFIRVGEVRIVRPYQKEVLRALDHAVELGKRRFLVELPTGTGKTDVICLHSKRMFQAGRAERLLFLVDREQLAEQAIAALQDLCPEYSSYWLKAGMAIQHKQITVCLLQTMIGLYPEFTSGYFDIVIADECHRSIYGAWQAALTHFDAFHIGLTAMLPNGIELRVYRWKQRLGGPELHRRFILTERGGMWIDQGLDAGKEGERTDVGLVTEEIRRGRWEDYDRSRKDVSGNPADTTFELIDAFAVNGSGCSRMEAPIRKRNV